MTETTSTSGSKGREKPRFEFDRYVNGALMAEGVTIERQSDLASACAAAATLAARGPKGEVPVLVLRTDAPLRSRMEEAERENDRLREAMRGASS